MLLKVRLAKHRPGVTQFTLKGEPVKKAEQLVTEGIARQRIIDKLLKNAQR